MARLPRETTHEAKAYLDHPGRPSRRLNGSYLGLEGGLEPKQNRNVRKRNSQDRHSRPKRLRAKSRKGKGHTSPPPIAALARYQASKIADRNRRANAILSPPHHRTTLAGKRNLQKQMAPSQQTSSNRPIATSQVRARRRS